MPRFILTEKDRQFIECISNEEHVSLLAKDAKRLVNAGSSIVRKVGNMKVVDFFRKSKVNQAQAQ